MINIILTIFISTIIGLIFGFLVGYKLSKGYKLWADGYETGVFDGYREGYHQAIKEMKGV